jgi:putative ABC transport system permease protein
MTIWNRLKYLWPAWRRQEEREMREELEALTAIAGGKELGNLTLAMENVRATWGWTWLESILADIRYALRALRKQPAFAAVAVLSLALAIGANSAIFSFADALLLRPLPVANPTAFFDVTSTTPDNPLEGMSFPDYRDLRDKSRSFSGLAAYRLTHPAGGRKSRGAGTDALCDPGERQLLSGHRRDTRGRPVVSARRSSSLRAACRHGQLRFLAAELRGQPVRDRQHPAPQRDRFHDCRRNPGVLYRTGPFRSSQHLCSPRNDPAPGRRDERSAGRPRTSRSGSQGPVERWRFKGIAHAELAIIGAALEREYPKTNRNRHMAVRTELQRRIQQSPQLLALAKMLMGLVALILIIACSNVANLLLARARARSREIAIRLSIGAGRSRVVRQLMTESLIVALAGGVTGLFVAYGGIRLLEMQSVPSDPPFVLGVQLDWRVVEFSLLAALASCIFFGLAPAWQAARTDFVSALKTGGGGASGKRRTFGRDVLVVGQIALAMVVLIGAGMFLAGFRNLLVMPPEFRTDHLISLDTAPALVHYSPEQTMAFYRRLVDRVRTMAGVAGVAMTEARPLSPSQTAVNVVPEGYQFPKGREKEIEFGAAVDAAYFRTMHVEIKRGRAFTDDDRAGSRRVAIVNQQFVKTYWPAQDPIGKRVRVESMDGMGGPAAEVVGVAKTGHYLAVNEAPAPYVYVP